VFDAGLQINANNPSLLKASSLAYQRMGEGAKGVERARKLVETTKSADDQFFLATLQESTGDTQGAIDTYKAIIQANAKYWQAMNNLAFILSARSKPEIAEAVKLATQAAALAPDQAIVIDTLGWAHLLAGDAKSAKSALLRATELAPDNAKYHYHLGLAERTLGNKAAAIASLKKAISLNPNDAEMKRTLRQVETSR
jgi:tetratricopeptide (TPR) repeat protein